MHRRWRTTRCGPDQLSNMVAAGFQTSPPTILMVSAHWEEAPLSLSATTGDVPLVYDFYGFPQHYYEVTYAAPGAPALAASVAKLMHSSQTPVQQDPGRGLDHGAYVPLVEMYPEADIPVLQMSMPTLDPRATCSTSAVGWHRCGTRAPWCGGRGSPPTTSLVQPGRRAGRNAQPTALCRVRQLGPPGPGE